MNPKGKTPVMASKVTQIINMPTRSQTTDHPIADCPECGALANIEELKPGGIIIKCSICKFTVSSAIDPMFAVIAWNDLFKRGAK